MLRTFFFAFIFLPVLPLTAAATGDTTRAVQTEATYTGDHYGNLRGGIRTGYAYLGLAQFHFGLNTGSAGLWQGGELYVMGAATHGRSPSGELTGDIQVASNIEAGDHIYLQEFWYQHSFGDVTIAAGLQDLNAGFVTCSRAGLLLNSSFGIMPTITGNLPVPVFPLTALGITGHFPLSSRLTFSAAVFDGSAEDFATNPYNISWQLSRHDGLLSFGEFTYSSGKTQKYTLRTGIYYHSGYTETTPEMQPYLHPAHAGLYLIGERELIKSPTGFCLNAFLQAGTGSRSDHPVKHYLGTGIHTSGLFKKRKNDEAGFAVARAATPSGCETTIELTCRAEITENFSIQPDLQYIIHPGIAPGTPNALVFILRAGINID